MNNQPNHNFSSDSTWLDLNEDGVDESLIVSCDTDRDGHYDKTLIRADGDGDGNAETVSLFEDIDVDSDGKLDRTIIQMDFDGDGITDLTEEVAYIDYESSALLTTSFDSTRISSVIGDPLDDLPNWHCQERPDTCAVACQEFILDDFGKANGLDFTEDQLVDIATANGWYTPGGGTSLENTGKLLEIHGIPVEREFGVTLEELAQKLDRGEKVIAAVDIDEIWNSNENLRLEDFSGDTIPGQDANHAVQVIGIDCSNPQQPMVILNDPGHPQGQGAMIPADRFINAWTDSGNYMAATAVNSPPSQNGTVASTANDRSSQTTLAGYHDREGNWWWSDGTVEPDYNWETGYV